MGKGMNKVTVGFLLTLRTLAELKVIEYSNTQNVLAGFEPLALVGGGEIIYARSTGSQ